MIHGSFVLKPDFFENIEYYNKFVDLLEQHELYINNAYIIKDYVKSNEYYRMEDLKKKYKTKWEVESNFERTKISLYSYKSHFKNNFGLLVVVFSKNNDNKHLLYDKMLIIKNTIRDYIKDIRGFDYLFINNNGKRSIIAAQKKDFKKLSNQYGKNIKLAFINGIHLEDYKLFKTHFCEKIFLKMQSRKNEILISDIPKLYSMSEIDIDLHIHSINSDGEFSVEQIIKLSKKANIKYISITDHDLYTSINSQNINTIRGIECNSIITNRKQHVLCYNFDVDNKRYNTFNKIQISNRIKTLKYRVSQLRDLYGVSIPEEIISELINKHHFSRKYLAQTLVDLNVCSSIDCAQANYINKLKHGSFLINISRLKNIMKNGSLVVLAHPLGNYKHKITFQEFLKIYNKSIKYFDGIECFYSNYSNEEIAQLIDFAKQHKKIITFGSDFHGLSMNISIGDVSKEKLSIKLYLEWLIAKYKFLNRRIK